jgi:hypothetical protein
MFNICSGGGGLTHFHPHPTSFFLHACTFQHSLSLQKKTVAGHKEADLLETRGIIFSPLPDPLNVHLTNRDGLDRLVLRKIILTTLHTLAKLSLTRPTCVLDVLVHEESVGALMEFGCVASKRSNQQGEAVLHEARHFSHEKHPHHQTMSQSFGCVESNQ